MGQVVELTAMVRGKAIRQANAAEVKVGKTQYRRLIRIGGVRERGVRKPRLKDRLMVSHDYDRPLPLNRRILFKALIVPVKRGGWTIDEITDVSTTPQRKGHVPKKRRRPKSKRKVDKRKGQK